MELKARKAALFAQVIDGDGAIRHADRRRRRPRPLRRLTRAANCGKGAPDTPVPP